MMIYVNEIKLNLIAARCMRILKVKTEKTSTNKKQFVH